MHGSPSLRTSTSTFFLLRQFSSEGATQRTSGSSPSADLSKTAVLSGVLSEAMEKHKAPRLVLVLFRRLVVIYRSSLWRDILQTTIHSSWWVEFILSCVLITRKWVNALMGLFVFTAWTQRYITHHFLWLCQCCQCCLLVKGKMAVFTQSMICPRCSSSMICPRCSSSTTGCVSQ